MLQNQELSVLCSGIFYTERNSPNIGINSLSLSKEEDLDI